MEENKKELNGEQMEKIGKRAGFRTWGFLIVFCALIYKARSYLIGIDF